MIQDFMGREITFDYGGATITVAPPTVRTVIRFIERFAPLIKSVIDSEKERVRDHDVQWSNIVVVVGAFLADRKNAADVLSECVRTDRGHFGTFMETLYRTGGDTGELLLEVVYRINEICDIDRIASWWTSDSASCHGGPSADSDPWSIAITSMGRAHGCSPQEVLDWPMTIFQAAVESHRAIAALRGGPRGQETRGVDITDRLFAGAVRPRPVNDQRETP